MISIIITSFKEPKTIGRAIEDFLNQDIKFKYEILVLAPDSETLDVVKKYKNKKIKTIKDYGKGKPAALNLAFSRAKGDILILTDGDVCVSNDSVNNLIKHFKDKEIGGVTGRVISSNSKNNMFGYWAYLLTSGFHNSRLLDKKNNKNTICSGYLYAIRKNLIERIPENILADDAFISLHINQKGFKTIYESDSEVYVKYPTNLPDWIRQKKRTASRYYQLKNYFKLSKMSSFKQETLSGSKVIFKIKNFKHLFWFIFLIIMRFYIWFRVFFDKRLWKREFKKTWQRVESTK